MEYKWTLDRNKRAYLLYELVLGFFDFCDWTDFFSSLKLKEPKKIGELHSKNMFWLLIENRPCKSLFIMLTKK